MTELKLEELWPGILGFYPCYQPNGSNSTCIVFHDGRQHIDSRKTKTFLQSTARIFASDLTALRQNYQGFLGCKGMVPLPLHRNFVLVPFKVRRPQYKDHGATGYAVLKQIKSVEQAAPVQENDLRGTAGCSCVSRLCMTGGIIFESMEKAATLRRRLGEAARVRQEYCRFYGGSSLLSISNLMRESFAEVPEISGALRETQNGVIYHIHVHTGDLSKIPKEY